MSLNTGNRARRLTDYGVGLRPQPSHRTLVRASSDDQKVGFQFSRRVDRVLKLLEFVADPIRQRRKPALIEFAARYRLQVCRHLKQRHWRIPAAGERRRHFKT